MFVDKLPEGITMQLYLCTSGDSAGIILFSSSKKWLHPLFELEEFLSLHTIEGVCRTFEFEGGLKATSADLFLRDRIIGRAAAFLILRLGIRKVETDLVSYCALPLLNEHAVTIETIDMVDAIKCITENLLKDTMEPEEAYSILSERRGKELERMRDCSYPQYCD